jgi:hypothetical protein
MAHGRTTTHWHCGVQFQHVGTGTELWGEHPNAIRITVLFQQIQRMTKQPHGGPNTGFLQQRSLFPFAQQPWFPSNFPPARWTMVRQITMGQFSPVVPHCIQTHGKLHQTPQTRGVFLPPTDGVGYKSSHRTCIVNRKRTIIIVRSSGT